MEIKKALLKDHLRVSKVSWRFRISTIFSFAAIYPWNLLLSFLFLNKTLRLNNLKTRTAMNGKISVFAICVEVIIYVLLFNLHDFSFNWLV